MGDFVELALNHRKTSPIGIKLELYDDDADTALVFNGDFALSTATRLPKLSCLDVKSRALDLSIKKDGKYKAEFNYRPKEDPMNLRQTPGFRPALQRFFTDIQKIEAEREKKAAKGKKARTMNVTEFMHDFFADTTHDVFAFGGSADVFRQLSKRPSFGSHIRYVTGILPQYERSFNYVSSFRLPPERTYYQRTKAAFKVEKFGENWVEQIVEWEQSKSRQLEKLKQAARKLKLLYDVRSRRYAGGRYEIRVMPHDGRVEASLVDVGFGISQFLPILVADTQLGKGSSLFVSQPEIHLHPSVQADFADYLLENHRAEKKWYLLETHSEYLLNRFRALIAKGQLHEDDVAVYYLTMAKGQAKCHKLKFRSDGTIQGGPKEFFDTYMMDVMEIAMHA
jgi:hypothetical protein